jgi:uncharacterized protein
MRNFRSIGAIGLILLSYAFINPAHAINCRKARTQIDHAICANPELLNADSRLNRVYQSVLRSVGGKKSVLGRSLVKKQRFWMAQRNRAWQNPEDRCYRNDECLILMYEERIIYLENR